MTSITIACLDMAGTTVSDDGSVMAAFSAALERFGPARDTLAYTEAMQIVDMTMGQSKIDVFRDILGDEATAEQAQQLAGNPVHDPHELGHEGGGRVRVQLTGARDLLQRAVPHDADAVSHGQRFLLVVRDEQGGGAQPLLQRADLLPQLKAHLRVEGGQRLVEEQDPRGRSPAPAQRM
jgi:hypothetical protein